MLRTNKQTAHAYGVDDDTCQLPILFPVWVTLIQLHWSTSGERRRMRDFLRRQYEELYLSPEGLCVQCAASPPPEFERSC